ncbi:protein kinase domain-containing protein [Neorhizobium galegae]|uniref:protein kinase domain-containing protein n=1 Tax=Neorhizobium galegae TaxID=399 RepID=UPI000621BC17|nr:SUMF1/EgtB/PvdO family nonheme iron enzyme [Neorhizobium galegae]CDZ56630.1 Non-specific serine/threonine protein kinase [Neorhizobium galegae bv. orientalis]KAB1122711.1 SUMF1/EgtB/PvdO family nonheme iron enzyme [Neorhizobium galegae]MCQ1570305.1 SUMF1/EgtB/PvdO family nonheme iron enzyme [Neorhizobium galegae]MCQ1807854.1 SUMF1/EgtB/PvdO family nonheme iron enzyme [Neorhizobium galegae]UIY31856.1 SUMF1/EgtB/PvdO family nonheme iron enzyme [Neorhizobium galegae]
MRSDLTTRYSIGEPIYENEFIVYPGRDLRMDREVSIVVPDLALKADRKRFESAWLSINEAKLLTAQRFVEIIDLIPATPEDDNFYIVEKRPSKTLRQYLEEQEMIAFDRAADIGRHLLEGLATLHGAGYAHNALTDQCIYVQEDYSGLSVRIGNLHLISKIGEHIVPPYAPEFGAPEIYTSGMFSASPALDIYAMGMICYKLFLPRQTWADTFHSVLVWEDEHNREQSWKNIHLDPSNILPRLDILIPGFPADLASLVERMLSRDPARRPRTGADALEEFRHATIGRSYVPLQAQPLGSAPVVKKKKWSTVTIATFAVLIAFCVGVGIFTLPKLLGPDPKLVASVEQWKKAAEGRKASAIAAKAPERPSGDQARLSYDEGDTSLTAANAALVKEDYEAALKAYQSASGSFGKSVVEIAEDGAQRAKAAAVTAGAGKAPAFAEADKQVKSATESRTANDLPAAIKSFKAAEAAFGELASAMTAMTAAEKSATQKKEKAGRIGASEAAVFGQAVSVMDAAKAKGASFDIVAATTGFNDSAKTFDALIQEIMAAKDAASVLKAKVADLTDSISKRGGDTDPAFQAVLPKADDAHKRFQTEAYKLAVSGYEPVLKDLEAISARGFCPILPDLAFKTIDTGSYPIGNVRLMTSSLSQLGGILATANGAIKIDKPFCMQTRIVTRGEMAAFYKAKSDAAGAADFAGRPNEPATDVPFDEAEAYAAWMSQRSNTPVRLPSASEWMAAAANLPNQPMPSSGDVQLQWSSTPCEGGGKVAFMAQEGSTFAVCSDASAGGFFRVTSERR